MEQIILYLLWLNEWLVQELAETEELADMLIEVNHKQWVELNRNRS